MQAPDAGGDPLATRILAWVFASGAILGVITLALPHSQGVEELPLLGLAAAGFAIAAPLMLAPPFSHGALAVLLGVAVAMSTAAVHFSGHASGTFAFFYVWLALYAAYFFSPATIATLVGAIGIGYGGLLAFESPPDPAMTWVLAVGSILIATAIIMLLRVRVNELVRRLASAAETDGLTGLLNRRGFNEALEREIGRATRSGQPLALLIADLDRFKRVNDELGHPAGDEVLRRVAALLSRRRRAADRIARIGGEEFALILPYTDCDGARIVAKRVEAQVREEFASDSVPLTISVGIAVHSLDGESPALLMRSADQELYAAKAALGEASQPNGERPPQSVQAAGSG